MVILAPSPGAPLGGCTPKDPLPGSPLSPNCHWQIFLIGRKSCFPGPLALIHSSWLCSFKNSEGTLRVCRMRYLSSWRRKIENWSEEIHILQSFSSKLTMAWHISSSGGYCYRAPLSPVWFIHRVISGELQANFICFVTASNELHCKWDSRRLTYKSSFEHMQKCIECCSLCSVSKKKVLFSAWLRWEVCLLAVSLAS